MPITSFLEQELARQQRTLSLIPSDNHASGAVRAALSSVIMNRYAEGYPGARYYGGMEVVDQLETAVCDLARQVFKTDYHVNVQPYSGSPANLAAYSAVLQLGDTVLALGLAQGGHLTHGHKVSFTSQAYNFVHYEVDPKAETVDADTLLALAKKHKPKLIVCGATAYPRVFDFAMFRSVADAVGAYLMVDMAHISGLIAGGSHATPFGIADIITSTTHKSLRGPRGGMIFCKPELAKQVDKAVFPGLQGGPHEHTIAALGVALEEALRPEFAEYAARVVKNAQALAATLQERGVRLVAGGTDTHLVLADLRPLNINGKDAQDLLEAAGIIANKNSIPFDPASPRTPSGLRLGTPAITTRGFTPETTTELATLVADLLAGTRSPEQIRPEVEALALRHPLPE